MKSDNRLDSKQKEVSKVCVSSRQCWRLFYLGTSVTCDALPDLRSGGTLKFMKLMEFFLSLRDCGRLLLKEKRKWFLKGVYRLLSAEYLQRSFDQIFTDYQYVTSIPLEAIRENGNSYSRLSRRVFFTEPRAVARAAGADTP